MRPVGLYCTSDEKKALKCSLWSRAFSTEAPCVLYLHGNASCRMEALPHVAPYSCLVYKCVPWTRRVLVHRRASSSRWVYGKRRMQRRVFRSVLIYYSTRTSVVRHGVALYGRSRT